MIAKLLKLVRSYIHEVASPKLLLTAAKILTACIVAVTIMLVLVGGTTPTTFPLPDGKASQTAPFPSGETSLSMRRVSQFAAGPLSGSRDGAFGQSCMNFSCTTTKGTAF